VQKSASVKKKGLTNQPTTASESPWSYFRSRESLQSVRIYTNCPNSEWVSQARCNDKHKAARHGQWLAACQ
jgi:hypothetical protein